MKTRHPVVGIELRGGLGNQLFQYAAGLALADRLGGELRCRSSGAARSITRPLGLREFGLTWTECQSPRARGTLRAIVRWFGAGESRDFRGGVYFEEEFGRFDARLNDVTSTCYLDGYFQSWRYFEGRETLIRNAFDTEKLPRQNVEVEAAIRKANHPVAVHVRRGDYAFEPATMAFHGLLGADYYQRARRLVETAVADPTYFLFSDDQAAAGAELGDWPTRSAGVNSAHEDLRLMSLCEHFIIANSTFSWWGAWLGRAHEKLVVAPQNWFAPAHAHETVIDDRYPPDWTRT